jgi:5-methylcytosine-specific restriction enzyme A
MAWSRVRSNTRAARLPGDWDRLRAVVLDRDGHACQHELRDGMRCGAPATDVDHIGDSDDHDPANLRAMCSWHHAARSARQGAAARWAKHSEKRPRERHPGLK